MISMALAKRLANQAPSKTLEMLKFNLQALESIKLELGALTPPQQYLYDALLKELEKRK